MKTTRYFRDGDCYWKFDPELSPQQKTGFYSEWEDSYFKNIDEFLSDPGSIGEIGEDEAERPCPTRRGGT